MPPMTAVQVFIEALSTGQTNITKAFDRIFTKPYATQPWLGSIQAAGAFDGATLPQWAVDALGAEGLTPQEIDHVASWPDALKEQVRQVCVQAINASPQRNVRFRWGVGHGTGPALNPLPATGSDPHRVWFETPRSAVAQVAADNIQAGLYGPPDELS